MVNRVEEIWSDLQARTAVTSSSRDVLRALNEQTFATDSTKKITSGLAVSGGAFAHSVGSGQPARGQSPGTCPAPADLKTRCRPLLQRLVDVSNAVRLAALSDLQAILKDCNTPDVETSDALSSWLGKGLIKCFADDSERTLHVFILGSGNALGAYFAEALNMVRPCLEDPFHNVNMRACACVELLAQQLGRRLQPVAKELTAQVMALLTHRRKAVRCAAVGAVRRLMFCGAHEMLLDMVAWRDPNTVAIKAFYEPEIKVNFCGKLSTDDAAAVRLAFVDALGDWLLHLDERIDHQGRLLPYLLGGLCDGHPPIRLRALQHLNDIGALYEKDNEKDLDDIMRYLPSEAHNIGWTPIADVWRSFQSVPEVCGGGGSGTSSTGGSCSAVFPEVFKERPRIGARRVVAASFPQAVRGIIGELRGWQPYTLCCALRLLQAYTVYVEDWMQQHLHELLPALLQAVGRACMERNQEAVDLAAGCCRLFGVFVTGEVLWGTLRPVLLDKLLEPPLRQAAAHLLQAYAEGASHRGGSDECLGWALDVLVKGNVADTQAQALKEALVNMLVACVRAAGTGSLSAQCAQTVSAMLRLQAWPGMRDAQRSSDNWRTVEEALEGVAQRVVGPGSGVPQLLERYAAEVVTMWGECAVQADVLCAAMQRLNVKGSSGG